MKDYEMMVASLYDGGWRSTDRDQLMIEYGIDNFEIDKICAYLDYLEDENLKENDHGTD